MGDVGDLARDVSDRCCFPVRSLGFLVSSSRSSSRGELHSEVELPRREAELGVEMMGKFSLEGLLHREGRVLVLFSKALDMGQESMNDF
jgi:hypothetical protein